MICLEPSKKWKPYHLAQNASNICFHSVLAHLRQNPFQSKYSSVKSPISKNVLAFPDNHGRLSFTKRKVAAMLIVCGHALMLRGCERSTYRIINISSGTYPANSTANMIGRCLLDCVTGKIAIRSIILM